MDTMLQIVRQEEIEKRFSKRLIDKRIKDLFDSSLEMQQLINQGEELLKEWVNRDWYASKKARLDQLKELDLKILVEKIFIASTYVTQPELFTSVSAEMAGRIGFADKKDSIQTMAEVLAVLCPLDLYDINKASRDASLMLVSRITLPDELTKAIKECRYLPPMVCTPLEVENNYSSGYLTHKDSLILGSGNHHNGDICLDVINTVNAVRLSLNTEFLKSVEEDPNTEFSPEQMHESAAKKGKTITQAEAIKRSELQKEQWKLTKVQSYETYLLMHTHGNVFHLTNKVDKRGRLYSQGFHINTQGTAFKRAAIDFADKEIVTGV